MSWNETRVIRAVTRQTFRDQCVVLVDRTTWNGGEVDVLGVHKSLRLLDIEIKVSRSDLKADAKKDKWWHNPNSFGQSYWPGPPRPLRAREWPPRVWKHYYAVPKDIWDDKLYETLPSTRSGVLVVWESRGGILMVESIRRAQPDKDAKPLDAGEVIDLARLASLRMLDAYQAIDDIRGRGKPVAEALGSDKQT